MTTIVVSQSNYLPWKGYFDLIRQADHLVLLDNVQFTRRDWRSRNLIKSPDGVQWLSVPVRTPSGRSTSVSEAELSEKNWAQKHLRAVELSYKRSPHFDAVFELLENALHAEHLYLSQLNESVLRSLIGFMKLDLEVSAARGPVEAVEPSERILQLVLDRGGTKYLSGPAAKSYLDAELFEAAGVEVYFFDYPEYPEYQQAWPPFRHDVSMVDVLLHLGETWPAALRVNP